jgi:hypothetical protein
MVVLLVLLLEVVLVAVAGVLQQEWQQESQELSKEVLVGVQELLQDRICFLQQVGHPQLLWLNFDLQLLGSKLWYVALVTVLPLNYFFLSWLY